MSKTETQSDAQKLSALLNVAMAFDHGRIGTDRRFVEMDATVVASVDSELRRLDAENKALRSAIGDACEGWNMHPDLRKHLETALWAKSVAAAKTGDAA